MNNENEEVWRMGKVHELLYFGKCSWKLQGAHHPWWNCVQEITKFKQQTGTKFTKLLTSSIASRLSINRKDLTFYSSIDSPFDEFHGIDGFIIWWTSHEKAVGRIVTFDITLKEEKEYKADILISPQKLNSFKILVSEITGCLIKPKPKIFEAWKN